MAETRKQILVIDDDAATCDFLREIFEEEGWRVATATTAEAALALAQTTAFNLIVSDIHLGARLEEEIDGIALLKRFRQFVPATPVILISGFGTLETAIEAVREGAFDFISKPFNLAEVLSTARRALSLAAQEARTDAGGEATGQQAATGLLGHSRQMIELYMEVARVAAYRSTVLIVGESGTGKELVARSLHAHSPRAGAAFVAVNCGALTETLLEAELFGHVRGAFTGAVSDKKGLWEEAEGGTIFLDEIGETSPALQVKLLRALQEGEIRRVGSTKSIQVDARVIAATNRDLEAEVKAGRFREDLYYRLSVITVRVPALRERREDIPLLAAHFLRRAAEETGKRVSLADDALRLLRDYEWSGNVRELENSIEYAVLHARGPFITVADLPARLRADKASALPAEQELFAGLPSLDEVERRYLLHVLAAVGGNRTRAAEVMKIDRRTLYRMAERFGINLGAEEK